MVHIHNEMDELDWNKSNKCSYYKNECHNKNNYPYSFINKPLYYE